MAQPNVFLCDSIPVNSNASLDTYSAGAVDLTVVVPVYRSERTLPILLDRVRAVMEQLQVTWEIIFVDDESPDGAWQVIKQLQAADPEHVLGIQLMRNFGQHNALMCGFHHVRGRFAVTIDDDLQNAPEDIVRLWDKIRAEDADVVYAVPVDEKSPGLIKVIGKWVMVRYERFVFKDSVCRSAFRIVRREALDQILNYDLTFTNVDGLLHWVTRRVASIEVTRHPRKHGFSGYSLLRLVFFSLDIITNFSLIPLQTISLVGIGVSVVGMLLGCYHLVAALLGWIHVSGYSSIIVAVLMLGGIQLFSLGVMGEYVGRIHVNINRKPQFLVRNVLEKSQN